MPTSKVQRAATVERTCAVASCSNCPAPHRARLGDGYWCISCLSWWRSHDHDDPANRLGLRQTPTGCVVIEDGERCMRPVVVKRDGWCGAHMKLAARNGSETTRRRRAKGSLQRLVQHAATAPDTRCIIVTGWNQRPKVRHRGKLVTAARAVWWIAEGTDPGEGHVLHTCNQGEQGCINRQHLYLGDHAQNMLDKIAAGTTARGEAHHQTKVTEDQALDIRNRYRRGTGPYNRGNCSELAAEFGVGQTTIRAIVRRENWRWLAEPVPA